ncbi:MAG: outer membrane lipid asymmetry maintenance protein MlaD [Pararhodobacter sp.]|nr:outer membrane lipid asymmetry maintenance protein MlaD [Pararhodobacter sp.]
MTYKVWEIALGAAVLVIAAGFVLFMLQTTGTRIGAAQGYTLTASFRSAEGVRPGTEVRLAGVRVGTVTELRLDPDSFRAEVALRVDQAVRLPADSTLSVSSEGLLGGTFMEILPGGMPFDLEPGDSFQDTQSAVSLIQLMLRFATGGDTPAQPSAEEPAEAETGEVLP